jgi:hypothetical protein
MLPSSSEVLLEFSSVTSDSMSPLSQHFLLKCLRENNMSSLLIQGGTEKRGKSEVDYEIPPRGQVPSAHATTWVRNFEGTGSALKEKA